MPIHQLFSSVCLLLSVIAFVRDGKILVPKSKNVEQATVTPAWTFQL